MPKPERWIDALGHSRIENLVVDIHRSMRGVGFSSSPSAKDPADSPGSALHLGAVHQSTRKGAWALVESERLVLHTIAYAQLLKQQRFKPLTSQFDGSIPDFLYTLIFQQIKSNTRLISVAQRQFQS